MTTATLQDGETPRMVENTSARTVQLCNMEGGGGGSLYIQIIQGCVKQNTHLGVFRQHAVPDGCTLMHE